MLNRRQLLAASGAAFIPGGLARVAFAALPTESRFVLVILRGAMDGLHAVPPYADRDYRRRRPSLALSPPGTENGALELNGYFGLHPALASLHALYAKRELLIVPATATAYRKRSHFDAQNVLENGSGVPFGARDGWLNRALSGLGARERRLGLALGPAVPLVLQGKALVRTWADSPLPPADEDFLRRLARTYEHDPLFARALADAEASTKDMDASSTPRGEKGKKKRTTRNKAFRSAAEAAARLLASADGPRVAVMESHGWDTHFAQTRRLKSSFEQLAFGITALKDGLGAHWRDTVVVVVSEFGRTVAENGSKGTDHGVGGVAMVLGGAVNGGRVLDAWPGLGQRALYEDRDLRPTVHLESVLKSVLMERFALAPSVLEESVFPGSRAAPPLEALFRET